ncbi:MAG: hypothetical protein ACRD5H_00255 [Nitrososphaerales archaeon]
MNIQDIFERGCQDFIPDERDNPDCIWFYRAFYGMRALCIALKVDIEPLHSLIHHALCISNGDFNLALQDLQASSVGLTMEAEPQRYYGSDYEPTFNDADVQCRAREIFVKQFKVKFPGKHINSLFAQEKWSEVQNKVREYAQTELEQNFIEWRKREDKREKEHAKHIEAWHDKCKKIAAIKAAIETICEREKNDES